MDIYHILPLLLWCKRLAQVGLTVLWDHCQLRFGHDIEEECLIPLVENESHINKVRSLVLLSSSMANQADDGSCLARIFANVDPAKLTSIVFKGAIFPEQYNALSPFIRKLSNLSTLVLPRARGITQHMLSTTTRYVALSAYVLSSIPVRIGPSNEVGIHQRDGWNRRQVPAYASKARKSRIFLRENFLDAGKRNGRCRM